MDDNRIKVKTVQDELFIFIDNHQICVFTENNLNSIYEKIDISEKKKNVIFDLLYSLKPPELKYINVMEITDYLDSFI